MIDENEVKMRIKLAKFEHETRKSRKELETLTMGKYMAKGIFWTIIASTTAYLAAILLVSFVRGTFDTNLTMFLNGNFEAFTYPFIWIPYVIFEACFILIAIAFYFSRYKKLEGKLEEYRRRQSTYNEFYNRRNQ